MNAGLASPADDKYHRDRVHLIIQKGSYGVDDVALARVLHIYDRDLACSQVITCRKSRAVALVGCNDVMLGIDPVCGHQIIAKSLELAVRYTRIKIAADYLYKFFNLHIPSEVQAQFTKRPACFLSGHIITLITDRYGYLPACD